MGSGSLPGYPETGGLAIRGLMGSGSNNKVPNEPLL
jgi:hypothetical protein